MELWESDLLDVQNIRKFNNYYKYLLTVIDVFSKFLHVVPLKSKTDQTVMSAFQSIFTDKKYFKPHKQLPLTLRADKGKEFLNKIIQDVLKHEGIQFQVFKNPDVSVHWWNGSSSLYVKRLISISPLRTLTGK
jgi:hypothetical protein